MKLHIRVYPLLAVATAFALLLAACRTEESAPSSKVTTPASQPAVTAPTAAATSGQGAASQPKLDEGVTATEIKLGGIYPLSGPASVYASIGRGAEAYFKYVNDQGGVNGRKINFKYLDDAYTPSKTSE